MGTNSRFQRHRAFSLWVFCSSFLSWIWGQTAYHTWGNGEHFEINMYGSEMGGWEIEPCFQSQLPSELK